MFKHVMRHVQEEKLMSYLPEMLGTQHIQCIKTVRENNVYKYIQLCSVKVRVG